MSRFLPIIFSQRRFCIIFSKLEGTMKFSNANPQKPKRKLWFDAKFRVFIA